MVENIPVDLVVWSKVYASLMVISKPLTRGALAREAGVHGETIRFYEKRGLLREPTRSAAGYREYSSEIIHRVRFIKRAQELGFTLNEVRELLALKANRRRGSAAVKSLAHEKLMLIERKIRDLQQMKVVLGRLVEACDGRGPVAECPIIAAMEEDPK